MGEVEALMAVMMMEYDTEEVVISVMIVTVVVVVGVVRWGSGWRLCLFLDPTNWIQS